MFITIYLYIWGDILGFLINDHGGILDANFILF
jgi:hypothetical protein